MTLYFLSNKINKDCLKIIYRFMYPTKKQITQWLIEHKNKSNCNNWHMHCNYGCNNKKYICQLYQSGIGYNIHKRCYCMNKNCILKYKHKSCNFINFLKLPHPSLTI